MALTLEQANQLLINNPSAYATPEALRALISQLDITTAGQTTVLYSGPMGQGIGAGNVALTLAQQNNDIRIIDKTELAKFLDVNSNKIFATALENIFGDDPLTKGSKANDFLFGSKGADGIRIPDGAWDDASRRFAEAATGDVQTLTPFAASDRVFAQTELKALLDNPNVTHIDGIPKADLVRLYNSELTRTGDAAGALSTVRSAVSANSVLQSMGLAIATDGAGNITGVDTGKFFGGSQAGLSTHLPANTPNLLAFDNLIQGMNDAQRAEFLRGVDAIREGGRLVDAAGALNSINKLGILGDALGLLLAASDAHAASAAGDTARANAILANWAAGFAGGLAGGLAAAKIAAMATLPIAATGPVGAIFASILTLGAGFFGAICGEEGAKAILQEVADFFGASTNYTPPRRAPLVLDLDGDGIETVGADPNHPILFDHDADGMKTGSGWIQGDDAFLVLDRNGNGLIDSGRELFGDATLKSNGQLASDGFDALADLDANRDGVLNASDAAFGNLRLWRDLNQDGTSQGNELFTLNQLGIAGINVGKTQHDQVLADRNQIADLGSFIRADGSTGTLGSVADVNLVSDTFHRTFTDTLPTNGRHPGPAGHAGLRRRARPAPGRHPGRDALIESK